MGELRDDLLLIARQEQACLAGPLAAAEELQAFDLHELLEALHLCCGPQSAVRFIRPSPAGGMVSVRVSQVGHRILSTLADQGPSIPEQAR